MCGFKFLGSGDSTSCDFMPLSSSLADSSHFSSLKTAEEG